MLGMGTGTRGYRMCKASSQSRKSAIQSTAHSRASRSPGTLPAETNEPQTQKTGAVPSIGTPRPQHQLGVMSLSNER